MALDGVDILESDLGQDLQIQIIDMYNNGFSKTQIISKLKKDYEELTEPIDQEIFTTSTCLLLWKIQCSDIFFDSKLKEIVQNGADRFWSDNFDELTVHKRNKILNKLLVKISIPNHKPLKRIVTKKIENDSFYKGEILYFKIDDYYRCLIFENFYQYRKDAYYEFIPTSYKSKDKPMLDTLLLEEIPVSRVVNKKFSIDKVSIFYKDIDQLKQNIISLKNKALRSTINVKDFIPHYYASIENLEELDKKIEDILLGRRIEFYNCFDEE